MAGHSWRHQAAALKRLLLGSKAVRARAGRTGFSFWAFPPRFPPLGGGEPLRYRKIAPLGSRLGSRGDFPAVQPWPRF